jgi:hypothetical protein
MRMPRRTCCMHGSEVLEVLAAQMHFLLVDSIAPVLEHYSVHACMIPQHRPCEVTEGGWSMLVWYH